jgi:hypothetical protein
MKPPYIKLYVKDLICDSLDMTDEELGAYMKTFFKAYRTGTIPKAFADHSLFKELHSSSENYEKVCEKNKTNGKRGGRPKKTTFENTVENTDTSETQWVNFGNPNETQTKPTLVNQEPITNNQEQEVKKKNIKKKNAGLEKPEDVSEEAWQGWLALRKAKNAPVTELVIKTIRKESESIGWTLEQALVKSCQRNWQGFEASWVQNEMPRNGVFQPARPHQIQNRIDGGLNKEEIVLRLKNGAWSDAEALRGLVGQLRTLRLVATQLHEKNDLQRLVNEGDLRIAQLTGEKAY